MVFLSILDIYIEKDMIHSVWKPKTIKRKINYYELVEKEVLLEPKGKSGYKVIWTCDNNNCKYINKHHSISFQHLKKEKMCYDTQICRPCQCTGEGNGRYGDHRTWDDLHNKDKVKKLKNFMSEKWKGELNPSKQENVKIKKNQTIINEEYLTKIVELKNFKLINIKNIDGKRSSFTVECKKGHQEDKTYSNFNRKIKKFICMRCFYDSISLNLTDEELKKIDKYVKSVRSLTSKTYKKYKHIINPNNLPNGKNEYHIDHRYSIYEGFKNDVPITVMASKENLEMIHYTKNLIKGVKCSITLDELYELTGYLFKN
jgi:hypothetical protein